ncbi:MAG: hypothetical protein Kow0098_03230 [Ignavibacteriaceae bacterium]
MKRCSICKEVKGRDEFKVRVGENKYIYNKYACRDCSESITISDHEANKLIKSIFTQLLK